MKPRCQLMVATRTYSTPGQCEKRHNVKQVQYFDRTKVNACPAHRRMIDAGRRLERVGK